MRRRGRREHEAERETQGTRQALEEARAALLKEIRTKRGKRRGGKESGNAVEKRRARNGEIATEAEAATPSQQGAADAHEATATLPGTDGAECVRACVFGSWRKMDPLSCQQRLKYEATVPNLKNLHCFICTHCGSVAHTRSRLLYILLSGFFFCGRLAHTLVKCKFHTLPNSLFWHFKMMHKTNYLSNLKDLEILSGTAQPG